VCAISEFVVEENMMETTIAEQSTRTTTHASKVIIIIVFCFGDREGEKLYTIYSFDNDSKKNGYMENKSGAL